MDSPNFGSVLWIIIRSFVVTNPSTPKVLITQHITYQIQHNTTYTHITLSLYSNSISYVSTLVCQYQKQLCVSVHTTPVNAVVLDLGRILEARAPSPPSSQGSLSVWSRTRPSLQGPHAASSSPSSPRSIDTLLVFAKPPEARLQYFLFLVFVSTGILCFYIFS